jgi:TetR/AcrR family transcriptional regulator, cholesterol catabolism regulator
MVQNKHKITDAAKIRKSEIIDGALKLFAQYGYYSTSLNDVAAQIGVTKATLYYYFRNKEEIMRAILERSRGRMDAVLDLSKSALSPQDKLRIFVQYHIAYSSDGAELAKITFDQFNAIPKRMKTTFLARQEKVVRLLQNILEQGILDGSLAIDDVKITSYAILGLCNWTYHWYKPGGRLTPEQIAEQCIRLLENGYLRKTQHGIKKKAAAPVDEVPPKAPKKKSKGST